MSQSPPTIEEAFDIFQRNLPPLPLEMEVNVKIIFYAGVRACFDLVNYAGHLEEEPGFQVFASIHTSLEQEGS